MAARKKPSRPMLAIPEDVVTRLIDPAQVLPDDGEAEEVAANALDEAACEVAAALVATGRSLAHLHALRTAAETLGYLRGYRAGALAAGWAVHALANEPDRRQ